MKNKKLFYRLFIVILIIIAITSLIWAYNIKKELDSYEQLVINSPESLIAEFESIVAFQEKVIQNPNESNQLQMIEDHAVLTDNLFLHMNTIRGILMHEIDPNVEYSNLEKQIVNEMIDFRESSSLEGKTESTNALKSFIQEYKDYVSKVQKQSGIEEQ